MKICSIICEYNPFHEGHRYHLECVKKETDATHIACIMSGNYVQRGDVAVYDKWYRAKCAVLGGADLVVELPTPYVLTSAQYFAESGVHIAKELGSSMLSFGSECGDIKLLRETASKALLPETQERIQEHLSCGLPYHKAAALALPGSVADHPNNMLGIEYIKADPSLEFHTVKRTFPHDSADSGSASDIRRKLKDSALPPESNLHFTDYNEKAVLSVLRTLSADELDEISGSGEGLNNRLYKAAKSALTLEQLYSMTVSKRYPLSRIRRYVMCAYLGIKKGFPPLPPYIRVLALGKRGREILGSTHTLLPIVSKTADFQDPLFLRECLCTDLYALFSKNVSACGDEYTKSPFYSDKLL